MGWDVASIANTDNQCYLIRMFARKETVHILSAIAPFLLFAVLVCQKTPNVPEGNQPPSISSDSAVVTITTIPFAAISYVVNTTDPDGDSVSLEFVNGPIGFSLAGNTLSWNPTADDTGLTSVMIIAVDLQRDSDTLLVQIHVLALPLTIDLVSRLKLGSTAVSVANFGDNHVFVSGLNSGLHIVDVTDPAATTLASTLSAPGEPWSMTGVGNELFLSAGQEGFRILDINTPQNPVLKAFYDTPGYARGIAVSPGYCYVADGRPGICVIDIRDQNYLHLAGIYDTTLSQPHDTVDYCVDLQKVGDFVFVADGYNGLHVLRVEANGTLTGKAIAPTPGKTVGVAVANNMAYVAVEAGGVALFDVSEPARPRLLGNTSAGDSGLGISLADGVVLVAAGQSGLMVFRFGDVTHVPTGIISGINARSLDADGRYAYIADGNGSLKIADLQVPSTPSIVGTFQTNTPIAVAVYPETTITVETNTILLVDTVSELDGAGVETYSIALDTIVDTVLCDTIVSGVFAYVVDGDGGMLVINATQPSAPFLVGSTVFDGVPQRIAISPRASVSVQSDSVGDTLHVIVIKNLYAASAYGTFSSGEIQQVDLRTKALPTRLGTFKTTGRACGLQCVGDKLFVADGRDGVKVFSMNSGTGTLSLSKSYDTTPGLFNTNEYATSLCRVDSILLVADGYDGLLLLNVHNPLTPFLLGQYDHPGYAADVAATSNYAYVAAGTEGVFVLDIRDRSKPVRVSQCKTHGYAQGVTLEGDRLFVADGETGVHTFNVQDPAAPKLLGYRKTPGSPWDVAVRDSLLFVADGDSGLTVLRLRQE